MYVHTSDHPTHDHRGRHHRIPLIKASSTDPGDPTATTTFSEEASWLEDLPWGKENSGV